jgi:hypothetical protein
LKELNPTPENPVEVIDMRNNLYYELIHVSEHEACLISKDDGYYRIYSNKVIEHLKLKPKKNVITLYPTMDNYGQLCWCDKDGEYPVLNNKMFDKRDKKTNKQNIKHMTDFPKKYLDLDTWELVDGEELST